MLVYGHLFMADSRYMWSQLGNAPNVDGYGRGASGGLCVTFKAEIDTR